MNLTNSGHSEMGIKNELNGLDMFIAENLSGGDLFNYRVLTCCDCRKIL